MEGLSYLSQSFCDGGGGYYTTQIYYGSFHFLLHYPKITPIYNIPKAVVAAVCWAFIAAAAAAAAAVAAAACGGGAACSIQSAPNPKP